MTFKLKSIALFLVRTTKHTRSSKNSNYCRFMSIIAQHSSFYHLPCRLLWCRGQFTGFLGTLDRVRGKGLLSLDESYGNPYEAIRGMWESAYVSHFIRLFQKKFGFRTLTTQSDNYAQRDGCPLKVISCSVSSLKNTVGRLLFIVQPMASTRVARPLANNPLHNKNEKEKTSQTRRWVKSCRFVCKHPDLPHLLGWWQLPRTPEANRGPAAEMSKERKRIFFLPLLCFPWVSENEPSFCVWRVCQPSGKEGCKSNLLAAIIHYPMVMVSSCVTF
ncbi:hypothetical protein CEXT_144971 [Caerostris extrusa]|uniref:Uncharacterized protein n=1 Tax=Caerostris extrusa TaxID=172846 RepID=A0AAV4RD60_CAEEX|nr:hypothetical protein CEXT_144971 [Caerostris extrusa]